MKFLAFFTAVFAALLPYISRASERPCDIYWMTSDDTFKSWKPGDDFHAFMQVLPNARSPKPLVLKKYELAVVTADYQKGLRVTFPRELEVGGGYWGVWGDFTKEQVRELDALGPGGFHAAYLVDGVRCSNVISFAIDPSKPPLSGPSVRLLAIADLDADAIRKIGVRAVPPDAGDPKLCYSSIAYPEFLMDGIRRRPTLMIWTGPDGPLKPHTSSGAMPDLSHYEPKIEMGKSHQVQAFIGAYSSEKVELAVDRTVERRFDEAVRDPKIAR
jgi:hypothetical protein